MNVNRLKEKINRNEKLKWFIHRSMLSRRKTEPRLWVKWFVNPFFSKRGRGSVVKRGARLNVTPINPFVLGAGSVIERYTVVDNAVGAVVIGCDTRIGLGNTVIGPVRVGDHVITAQHVVLSGLNHNYEDVGRTIREQGVSTRPIVIEDDVWIGANSTVTAGVTIGRHSIVAAGSVVAKDIPPFSVCAGVPARMIKYYDPERKAWIRATE